MPPDLPLPPPPNQIIVGGPKKNYFLRIFDDFMLGLAGVRDPSATYLPEIVPHQPYPHKSLADFLASSEESNEVRVDVLAAKYNGRYKGREVVLTSQGLDGNYTLMSIVEHIYRKGSNGDRVNGETRELPSLNVVIEIPPRRRG